MLTNLPLHALSSWEKLDALVKDKISEADLPLYSDLKTKLIEISCNMLHVCKVSEYDSQDTPFSEKLNNIINESSFNDERKFLEETIDMIAFENNKLNSDNQNLGFLRSNYLKFRNSIIDLIIEK